MRSTKRKYSLYPKTALVTGASSGIGRAIARRLAEDSFRVVINYKDVEQEKNALVLAKILNRRTEAIAIRADVAKEKDVEKMINAINKKFGSLDAVINNAGINQTQPIEYLNFSDFQKVMDINVFGAMLVTRYALPLLKKSKSGRIIFVSSANAFLGGRARAAYAASKSALLGVHRALALELAPKILVNSVVPGYIDTKMFRKFSREPVVKKLKRIPLHRIGRPEEVAAVVSFLCSDDASYVTGQSLHVNGGLFFS